MTQTDWHAQAVAEWDRLEKERRAAMQRLLPLATTSEQRIERKTRLKLPEAVILTDNNKKQVAVDEVEILKVWYLGDDDPYVQVTGMGYKVLESGKLSSKRRDYLFLTTETEGLV
jgi:hypothetical protein